MDSFTACFCWKTSHSLSRTLHSQKGIYRLPFLRVLGCMYDVLSHAVKKTSRGSSTHSVAFSGLSCYMFMTGSCRCIPICLAPTRLAFLSCRRPLRLFLSLPFLPHSTLHKLPNPPSAATHSPHLSFPVH